MTTCIEIQEESTHVAAVDYIRQQLAQGKSLAKLLLATHQFENGRCTALSAVPLVAEELSQYGRGHALRADSVPQSITIGRTTHAAYPTPSAKEQLADVVYELLGSPLDFCLLENSIAQTGDPYLARAKSRLLFHGSDVYHALFNVDRDKTKITNSIREADRPPVFVGAVGRVPWPSGTDVASLHTLTDAQLSDFAKTARCVLVRAYDGEGYLVWKKTEEMPIVRSAAVAAE